VDIVLKSYTKYRPEKGLFLLLLLLLSYCQWFKDLKRVPFHVTWKFWLQKYSPRQYTF